MSFSSRRMSLSPIDSIPLVAVPDGAKTWVAEWQQKLARDLMDSCIVTVDPEISVEDACEKLLSTDGPCLLVKSQEFTGLFDFADVNAFLTLAATRHTYNAEDLRDNQRISDILSAARAGHVPVRVVSNLSDKNPLQSIPHNATVMTALKLFSRGSHRVIQSDKSDELLGILSDRGFLSWFFEYCQSNPSLQKYISNPLGSLPLPCLYLYSSVISAPSTDTVLDAMKLMSEEGVSSIAVLDVITGSLLSAVSVTDIAKLVAPQSKGILSTPLHSFVSLIKEPDGSTDGEDRYPVFSVSPRTTMLYTIEKLVATNSHRLFVTRESEGGSPVIPLSGVSSNLTGIVSTVDVLSLFARLANIRDIDPTRMQRHRRASSVSSNTSSTSDGSRSNSRTGIRRTASTRAVAAKRASTSSSEAISPSSSSV